MVDLYVPDPWSTHGAQTDPAVGIYPSEIDRTGERHRNGDSLVKVTTSGHIPGLSQTPGATSGESGSSQDEPASDAASVHSMPIVSVTEPQSPLARRPSSSSHSAELPFVIPSSSESTVRAQTAAIDNPLPAQDRRDRHRSAIEIRSGRLSGFFNNFMHRREPVPSPLSSRYMFRDERSQRSPTPLSSPAPPRAPPSPPPRPITPPPQLAPPTLQELGLSLSVVTADLSPSHISTPPWSGAFLEPHYLLLCHAQGLDVLSLVSPPAQEPYALVRRVSFKSVVVMEHRGVLVAIAGRRDGVRVYALDDVKKAVEWRIDFEVRRERERMRREVAKKGSLSIPEGNDHPSEKRPKTRLSTPSPVVAERLGGKVSHCSISTSIPLVPTPVSPPALAHPEPSGLPPPYVGPPDTNRQSNDSAASSDQRSPFVADAKDDWQEGSSDEEAIDIVAAGASGSEALDERTSAIHSATSSIPTVVQTEAGPLLATPNQSSPTLRRNRPANLDLSLSRPSTAVMTPPSPTPTLITLRQALAHCPGRGHPTETTNVDIEDDDDDEGGISLAQALLESRLPDLPPVGSRCPQQPILITPTVTEDILSPRSHTSDTSSIQSNSRHSRRRRRRWSLLDGVMSNGSRSQPAASSADSSSSTQPVITPPSTVSPEQSVHRIFRSHSTRSRNSNSNTTSTRISTPTNPTPAYTQIPVSSPAIPTLSRFIPRILSNALHTRRSEDHIMANPSNGADNDSTKSGTAVNPPPPPPKLEYVKLPGTKGALFIKAVETAKKSFLAILCGENGEKVELFAGTYRTALGLSRTFILPDSPRSFELQLQGDDLVEIFLVFSHNVFGLEPATVRVREVRIGRAERRAARRRARELRSGDMPNEIENTLPDEDPSINVNIGVSVSVGPNVITPGEGAPISPLPSSPVDDANGGANASVVSLAHAEELVALASTQAGTYTTFQQLSFAPKFPLASIADDYIIPPTYPNFMQYRTEHEPETNDNAELTRIQFSPPGLPVPANTPPCRWFYRDPKGVVHGPWKASLMQTWYKDSLLPPDLPIRKEGETEFILLKDLRLQCVDPMHPFRSSPPPPNPDLLTFVRDSGKPLLKPISLLAQPNHFGPPALFFSSRGGHSTSIVDARGKSVLKGRFLWSEEPDNDSQAQTMVRMGDVKRLEAFDVKDRAVLVAMRQGGLEAVDLGDALLRPGDESRSILPQFCPPPSRLSRRGPFVWKIGTPVFSSPTSSTVLSSKSKGGHIKKHSTAAIRSPVGKLEFSTDGDDTSDEILFLGRKNDAVYMCERNAGSFRILRLCPS